MMDVRIFCVDGQTCFCDPKGSLYVKNGEVHMQNLANLIDRVGPKITDIHATLDSHTYNHISFTTHWKDKSGKNPPPFTLVSAEDVENGTFRAAKPSLQSHALKYVKELKKNNRYQLVLWPDHAVIGTLGHTLFPAFEQAVERWSKNNFAYADYITKGSNLLTEHYSAVQADVPDPSDPSTQLNVGLVNTLSEADLILIGGEASSHCISATIRDVVNNFADISYAKKMKILTDCCGPVPGFEQQEQDFFDFCKQHGIELVKSTEVLL